MSELASLRRSVNATLNKARSRTGIRPAVASVSNPSRGRKPGSRRQQVERALAQQRELIREIGRQIERLRAERRDLQRAAERAIREIDQTELEIELTMTGIDFARRRGRELQNQIAPHAERLKQARRDRRQVNRAMLETHATVARIAKRLER